MEKISLKYRTWYKGVCPKPIKLEVPGWAGNDNQRENGEVPQPWHCKPFLDASTYGLELNYSFETECHVKNINGKLVFEGDFSEENTKLPEVQLPPFLSFSKDHFGMTSCLDIKVPDGYVLRTEPHPAFYTDTTGTFPCCIPGHLQTYWWPKVFFVVFKNPPQGGEVIFRKGEPYGQLLIVPTKVLYDLSEMNEQETKERMMSDFLIENNKAKIVKKSWIDNKGNKFNDKYRQLSKIFSTEGYEGFKKFLYSFLPTQNNKPHKKCPVFKTVNLKK